MILAMQTETISRQYSQKISNQALFFTNADNSNDKNVALCSGNFANMVANAIAAGYRLEELAGYDNNGKPLYKTWEPEDGQVKYYWTNTTEQERHPFEITVAPGATIELTKKQYEHLNGAGNGAGYADAAWRNSGYCSSEVISYGNSFNELGLLEALNNGTLRIVSEATGEVISLSANNGFTEAYYTDDDADAEAEYKRATAAIQVKEKRLQMELQQVESQQKACETEMESVKKVIEKNIEKTFKVFS